MERKRRFSLTAFGSKLLSLEVVDQVGKSIGETIKPKPKPESQRGIPPELMDSYNTVEAFIMAKLAINDSRKTGESPFNQGEMGGSDNEQNSLDLLNTKFSDENIAKRFVRARVGKEYENDPQVLADVTTALRSIRGINK